MDEVTTLAHKISDNTVEYTVFIAHRLMVDSVGKSAQGLPVLSCAQLTEILRRSEVRRGSLTYFGTISEKSSNLILPTAVSPMDMSKKTMGRPFVPAPDIVLLDDGSRVCCKWRHLVRVHRFCPIFDTALCPPCHAYSLASAYFVPV